MTIKQKIKIEMAKTIKYRILETPTRGITAQEFKTEILRMIDNFIRQA
jgi:hypothetical protein